MRGDGICGARWAPAKIVDVGDKEKNEILHYSTDVLWQHIGQIQVVITVFLFICVRILWIWYLNKYSA